MLAMIYLACCLYFSMPVIDFSIYFNFISIVFSFFDNYATEANFELYYFSLALTFSSMTFDFSIYFFDYSLSFSSVCFYLFVCSTTFNFSFLVSIITPCCSLFLLFCLPLTLALHQSMQVLAFLSKIS